MLILTALVILLSLVGGPARLLNTRIGLSQPPEDFQYWTEEQQNQFFEGQQAMQGPSFIYILPLLGTVSRTISRTRSIICRARTIEGVKEYCYGIRELYYYCRKTADNPPINRDSP